VKQTYVTITDLQKVPPPNGATAPTGPGLPQTRHTR
jgi:hypothetical protein